MVRAQRCFTTWRKGNDQGKPGRKGNAEDGSQPPRKDRARRGASTRHRESRLHAGLRVGRTGRSPLATGSKTLRAQWCWRAKSPVKVRRDSPGL